LVNTIRITSKLSVCPEVIVFPKRVLILPPAPNTPGGKFEAGRTAV
jgi:hypothetical protein